MFLDFLKDRGVTGTAHQRHVQGFLNWIHNKRKIEGFHYWRITKGKEPDFEIQIFTPEEITEYKRLIFLHPNLTWRRAWMLAYYCFMRAGEIWSLRTQDIILDGHRPHVFITDVDDVQTKAFPTGWTPKAHIKRRVGIHKDLAEFLKKDLNNNPRFWYLEKNTKRAQKLPPNSVGRMAFSDPHGLSVAFMGLRDQQFKWPKKIDFLHALRRTAITRNVEAGTPKEDLRYLCGHKEEKTTTKYYIWVDKQKALEKVNTDL